MKAGPTIVLITGPPGTGKSTLADEAALMVGGSVLAWDWVMAGMTGFDNVQAALREMSPEEYRRVGWSVLWNLAAAQLRSGRSAVLDGVARAAEVSKTRQLAREEGAKALVVLTHCGDRDLHRTRIDGRRRDIPGWHELDWDHVDGFLSRWEPPTDCDLVLDAAHPLDLNLGRLTEAITG